MGILFSNGFGIGATPGGGGGGGPVVNCSPSSTYSGNVYFNNGTPLTWSDDTTGYSLYTGGFTANDDGYSNNPVATLPSNFFMACTGSTSVYMSTNGFITIGVGSNNWSQSPQGANPPYIGGNVGDLFINTGASLGGGLTQGAYYKITDSGNFMKFELKVFEVLYQQQGHESSYQINLYKDSTYQWIETLIKDTSNQNYSLYNASIGPTSATNVAQAPSTTSSQVWRGDLSGQNWEYMGEGSVSTTPILTQYSNNGSTNNQGLILSLDGQVSISGNTILDQSGNGNNLGYIGTTPDIGSYYYDFNNNTIAQSFGWTLFNNLLNTMSMTMWVNFPTLTNGASILSRTSGNGGGWALRASSNQFNLVKYNEADQYSNGSFTINTNTWYHIGVVQGGTSLMFTLNGQVVGSVNNSSNGNFAFNSNPFYLCYDSYINSTIPLKIAKLKIWDTFKTSSDILSEFNTDKTFFGY